MIILHKITTAPLLFFQSIFSALFSSPFGYHKFENTSSQQPKNYTIIHIGKQYILFIYLFISLLSFIPLDYKPQCAPDFGYLVFFCISKT